MMKLLFLIFVALLPSVSHMQSFEEKVEEGYSSYTILYGAIEEEQSNNYYHIRVIQGINDQEVTFGFSLFNEQAKSHQIIIESDGKLYYPKTTNRGDYLVGAVRMDSDVTLHVVDSKNKSKFELTIEKMTVAEFEATTWMKFSGQGKGLALDKLSRNQKGSLVSILLIVFGAVSFVFGGIIVYLAIAKKGLFNPERRGQNVTDFREIFNAYQQAMEDKQKEEGIILEEKDIIEEPLEEVQVYSKTRVYEEEHDEEADVHALLTSKGYRTDYSNLTEAEKNEVMLYLMQLRGLHDISEEQYRKEIIELWKK